MTKSAFTLLRSADLAQTDEPGRIWMLPHPAENRE
jgi:hypothetical protein